MSIFPVVEQITSGRDSTASTSHVITMPTGITAGELILVVFASSGNPGTIAVASSNMTWRYTASWGEESTYKFTCFLGYVTDSGTKTLTVSTSTLEETVHIVYRISGINQYDMDYDGYLDVTGYFSATSSATAGTNANPPSDYTYELYGEQDYLFIVAAVTETTVATVAPTDFGSLTTIASVNPNNVALSTAHRSYRTGSIYDPGTFTTAYDNWMTLTIGILPMLGCGQSYRNIARLAGLFNGLRAYWKLDSTTSATDSLGVYNGTNTSISNDASGKISNAYAFNGTSSYVGFGNILKLTTGMTISVWVKLSSTAGEKWAVENANHTDAYRGFRLTVYGSPVNQVGFLLRNAIDTNLDFTYGPNIADGTWHHVVATWDGTTAYLYVDNSKSTGQSWAHTMDYCTTTIFSLGKTMYDSNYWTGSLDEVGVWDRALTDAEVSQLYNSGSGRSYPFS